MNKVKMLFTVIVLSLAAENLLATENTCYQLLTDNNQRDSYFVEVDLDRHELRDVGPDYLAGAVQVVRALINDLGCARADINFAKTPIGSARSRCENLSPERLTTSRACYVETSLGIFWVHYGYFHTAQVIFYRWD